MNKSNFASRFRLQLVKTKKPRLFKTRKKAAVMIPFVEYQQELHLLLTLRSLQLKHHPGQISFPGGRIEANDSSPLAAALRETEEEIGLASTDIDVLGHFGQYPTISHYLVDTYVGFVEPPSDFNINKNEVQEVFTVPWKFLLDRRNCYLLDYQNQQVAFKMPIFPYEDKMIWGVTAIMIYDLVQHVTETGLII